MRANTCWCTLLETNAEEDLMYNVEDLDGLTLGQVEDIFVSERQALASAVQMHESYLAARAATRATSRFLSDYLDTRRASAGDVGTAEAPAPIGGIPMSESADGAAEDVTTEPADDDLPFDEPDLEAAEEAADEG